MPGIVMNVGPSAINSAGGGGGQTLGHAQGIITINVNNVTQANNILKNSAKQINNTLKATGQAAQTSAQMQIAAARTSAAQSQAASKSIIASNNVQASSYKLAAQQGTIASNANIQASKQTATQAISSAKVTQAAAQSIIASNNVQASSYKLIATQSSLAVKANLQGIQQQVAGNRLIISGLNVQAAQARAAARAQQQAAQQSTSAWMGVSNTLDGIRSELALISVGAGLIAASGINYASNLQAANIQLKGMLGGQTAATEMMENLEEQGRKAGLPFKDMVTFAVQLLPTLEGNTEELNRWFDIVRRTAVLNQGASGGIAGATFSLREAFLSVEAGGNDFVSLADRFNISKKALRDALEVSGGDFVAAMDIVLNKLGITDEAVDEMAGSFRNSFNVAVDAVNRLLSAGFGPFLQIFSSALQIFADWAEMMRETNPELLVMGASLIAIVAVGTPLLLLITQLTVAWAALGVAAQLAITRMLGIAGAVVGAYALGKAIGTSIGGSIRKSRGQEPLTTAEVNQNARNVLFNFRVGMHQAAEKIIGVLNEISLMLNGAASGLHRALQNMYQNLADATVIAPLKEFFQEKADIDGALAFDLENGTAALAERFRGESEARWQAMSDWAEGMGIEGFDKAIDAAEGYTTEQSNRIAQYSIDTANLAVDTQRQILEAEQEYGEQRSQTVRDYNKQVAREGEDFNRSRARAIEDYNQDIVRAMEDSARQRSKWEEDLARSIAKDQEASAERLADMTADFNRERDESEEDSAKRIKDIRDDAVDKEQKDREDSIKKIQKMEEDFNEDRTKSLRDHVETLRSAANQFDAFAIAEEQRRFRLEQEEAKKEHEEEIQSEHERAQELTAEQRKSRDESIRKEREQLAERLQKQKESFDRSVQQEEESLQRSIDNQREAHELQLAEQRENDALRAKQAKEDFVERLREEDEDRRIQRDRTVADHAEQLAEMGRQHGLRIAQIQTQAAEEREKLDFEFAQDMIDLGVRLETFEAEQKKFTDVAITSFDNFWKHMLDVMNNTKFGVGTEGVGANGQPQIPFIGAPPPPIFPVPGAGAVNTTLSGSTVQIVIYAAAGQSPQEIGDSAIDAYIKKVGPVYPY